VDNGLNDDALSVKAKGGGSTASAPLKSYTENFYEQFPFYLSIGMSADEYWNQDCNLTKYYRKAFELKQDRKNEELWLQGMYIYEAINDASPILHAFAKKGTKPYPYPKQPYPRTEKEAQKRKEAEEKARYEEMRARLYARAGKPKQGGN